jgi:hypothetical protein
VVRLLLADDHRPVARFAAADDVVQLLEGVDLDPLDVLRLSQESPPC